MWASSDTAVAVLMISIILSAAEPATRPADPDNRTMGEFKFDANSLTDVLENLTDQMGIKIDPDWAGMDKLGIARDVPVTLRLRDVPFTSVLTLILFENSTDKVKLDYTVAGNKIQIKAEAVKP
jgi:hypothetical protein